MEAEDFIENPAFEAASVFQSDANQTEKHFGNYKIVREIGRGGMGAVFLAERDDGEFYQQVALKVLSQALPDKEIIRYFKREREILASLNHPLIARLLDGGVTADGLPYFVMEYVEGVSVLEFATRENLSITERLELFVQICAAVGFAHKNLIVHRDIKPSNILITQDGTPKLLDFGLAKIVDANFVDENQTQTAFRAMTPAYASPEQTRGENVTTATDIYSLGVVLAELVQSPKSKVQSQKTNEGQTTKDEGQNLKGDLNNIVEMALREEPERRYKSVEAFAEDIARHLNGLPVSARPNTFRYRAGKFIKRNKVAVIAASLVILSLLAGLVISLRQTKIAVESQAKAESESAKSKKITKFMEMILDYANPALYAEGSKLNGQAKLIEVLDDLSTKIETEFPDDLDVQAELHHKCAEIYNAKNNKEKALFHAERALELRRRVFGEKNAEVAKDLYYLSAAMLPPRKIITSLKLGDQAIEMFREVDAENPNLPYLLENQGNSYLDWYSDFAAAEKYLTEAQEIFRRKDGENHFNTIRQYLNLGILFAQKGDIAKAEDYFREGERRLNQLPDENLRQEIFEYRAGFEQAKGNHAAAAEKILEDRLAEFVKNNDEDNPIADKVKGLLLRIYSENENYAKMVERWKDAIEIASRKPALNKDLIGHYKAALANVLFRLGRNDEAKIYFAEAYQVYKTVSPNFIENWRFERNIGQGLFYLKRYPEAEPILQKSADFYKENIPPNRDSQELFETLNKTKAFLKE
ncbi:MAG: protein kinase domain-containing protein [Pyrinomonadaceae bacterium]